MSTARPIKCRACRGLFIRTRPMQVACSMDCAAWVARTKREQAARRVAAEERRAHAKALLAIKPRAKLIAEAQAAVNRYVRLRDAALPCISCGREPSWGGQWHASHLRSVGAASAVRFHLWNIWRACSICNHHLSGNVAEYERHLRARIGSVKVDWLYAQTQRAVYQREYLIRLRSVMTKKAKRLEARSAAV